MQFEPAIPPSAAGATLSRRLAWLTGARLLFLSLLLVLVLFFGRKGQLEAGSFTVQVATATLVGACALTVVSAALLRSGRWLGLLADSQLVLDQLTWTVIIYLSGGAASGATSFYGLTCLSGAALTGRRGAGLAAGAAVLMYVPVSVLVAGGILPPPPDQLPQVYALPRTELFYHIVINLLVLGVVMLLSGYLAERLRLTSGELVRAEQRAKQAEHMALLGRLAAGLAHEVRNPLGSIAGSIQLLRQSAGLNEEDRQLCEIVEREARRLNDLVSDMVELSKPKPPRFDVVDPVQVAQDVVRLASSLGRGESDVAVHFEGVEQATVSADERQIRQLVWNLVRNGVQASNPGDEVWVRVERSGDEVWLSVEDRGVGIDKEAQARLFDAFFTTRSQGTGIGLAVVKRIADEHGFTLEVVSEAGRGALFRVKMPAIQ